MSEKIDEFCESLRTKLHKVENHLAKVGENVKAAPQQAKDAVRSSVEAAKARHEDHKQKAADAKAKLAELLAAKKDEVDSQIAHGERIGNSTSWKSGLIGPPNMQRLRSSLLRPRS